MIKLINFRKRSGIQDQLKNLSMILILELIPRLKRVINRKKVKYVILISVNYKILVIVCAVTGKTANPPCHMNI